MKLGKITIKLFTKAEKFKVASWIKVGIGQDIGIRLGRTAFHKHQFIFDSGLIRICIFGVCFDYCNLN